MNGDAPARIGRYQVERLLGAGAMGNVYLARDPEFDRAVAIKTVRYGSLPADSLDTFLERFRNEARAAAKLHHPNVVQVFDVGEERDLGPYLVFEYVPGASLKHLLKQRGPLEPEMVCRIADEVASALALAHGHGIIHRDIKPDNLLLTDDGHVKLADFGIARIPNADLTREGQFLGTPCYAAPETLRKGSYGPATDEFSLATVLYEATTGVRAFPGDDAVAVAHKVIHDEVEPPSVASHAPRELDAVFARALSKEPEQRFASAAELAAMLREAFENAGILEPRAMREPTGRTNPPPPDDDEEGESPLARVAIVLGILAIGIALVVSFQRDRQPAATPDASIAPALRDDPPRPQAPRTPRRPRRVEEAPRPAPSGSVAPATPPPGGPATPEVTPQLPAPAAPTTPEPGAATP